MKTAVGACFAWLLGIAVGEAAETPVWVAIGDGHSAYTSPDGITWKATATSEHEATRRHAIAYAFGHFYLSGIEETRPFFKRSMDGVHWSEVRLPVEAEVTALGRSPERLIAGSLARLFISTDGTQFLPGAALDVPSPPRRMAYGDTEAGHRFAILGRALILGTARGPLPWLATSNDGSTLEHYAQPEPYSTGIAYGAGHFVQAGRSRSAVLQSSHDGVEWQSHDAPTDANFRNVVWTGEQFLVSGGVVIYTSPDGLSWETQSVPRTLTILWASSQLALASTPQDGLFWSRNLRDWEPTNLKQYITAIASSLD